MDFGSCGDIIMLTFVSRQGCSIGKTRMPGWMIECGCSGSQKAHCAEHPLPLSNRPMKDRALQASVKLTSPYFTPIGSVTSRRSKTTLGTIARISRSHCGTGVHR
jgi:hypothetical protein